MVNVHELREALSGSSEWLLVRELGKSFPLYASEIEIIEDRKRAKIGFLDDKGFHSWRLNGFGLDGGEIAVDVAGKHSKRRETLRLVPRRPAAEVTAEIEVARMNRANEIAKLIAESSSNVKLGRVALNVENGRLAQIEFETALKQPTAAVYDVTQTLTPEVVLTSAILWLEQLGSRKKKPISDMWVICEKRPSKNAQKLHALLSEQWKAKITIIAIDRKPDPPRLVELAKRKVRDLWREKPAKLLLPKQTGPTGTAERIVDLSPDAIDLIYSRQGETLRFNGLPFARVRAMMGVEKAWFGTGREQRILNDEPWSDLAGLVSLLETNRSSEPQNKRHEFYRAAPEAWLESILRRNIKLLDANLILSPIYNQFRSSNDKIDLLALRRDGRLVIIELKTQPDRAGVFQAVDYWRKIELQRRRGVLAAADLFDGREIIDTPALVYIAAPAWSFHRDFEFFARCIAPEIELWRFELHQEWRKRVRVVGRTTVS